MAYVIDWSDPHFPLMREAPEGDTLDVVIVALLRHHLAIIESHTHAMEGMIDDVSN